jgi:hypothetical protein
LAEPARLGYKTAFTMLEARTNTSYYALRARAEAIAPEWWAAAHAHLASAPAPVRPS